MKFSYFSEQIRSSQVLCFPFRAGGVSYGRSSRTVKWICLIEVDHFPSWPSCLLNAVVEEKLHRVPDTGHLRPFRRMEWVRYMDCTMGGKVRWQGETSRWISGSMVGITWQGVPGDMEVEWMQAIGSQADRSNDHRASKMRGVYQTERVVLVVGSIDRTT